MYGSEERSTAAVEARRHTHAAWRLTQKPHCVRERPSQRCPRPRVPQPLLLQPPAPGSRTRGVAPKPRLEFLYTPHSLPSAKTQINESPLICLAEGLIVFDPSQLMAQPCPVIFTLQ